MSHGGIIDSLANLDAEKLVIGNLFQSGDAEAFSRACELLTENSFTLSKHKLVFAAMRRCFDAGQEINYGTVTLDLKRAGDLQGVGPLIDLTDGIPGLFNLETFCEQVAEAERLRKIWHVTETVQSRVQSRERSDEIVSEAEVLLASAHQDKHRQKAVRAASIVERAGSVDSFFRPELGKAIMTPWDRVNQRTGGLRRSQLWVIGGIAGTGKTSVALNIAEHAIFKQQQRVKIISREMDSEELLFNMVCTRARVDSQAVRQGNITAIEQRKLTATLSEFTDDMDDFLEIEGEDCSTAAAISASLRKNVSEGRPADLLIVDYLQLLHGMGRFRDRREEVDQIAYALKGIAKTFRIPVIALAQLNTRKLETEGGAPRDNVAPKRPTPPSLGDFRESAAIEQAADLAWILRRTDVEQQFHATQLVDAFLLKQRGGRTGKIPFKFHATWRQFEEIPEYQPERGVA
jgi:replicative DNA helicase